MFFDAWIQILNSCDVPKRLSILQNESTVLYVHFYGISYIYFQSYILENKTLR